MHRDAGKWRHSKCISPSVLSKERQRRWRYIFIIGAEAGKVLGVWRFFFQNFPKLSRKVFCVTFAYKFSPTKIIKIFFWCDLQNRSSCDFLPTLGAIFLGQEILGAILPGFWGILPSFPANQNFWEYACTHCNPPPTQLLLITAS